MEDTDKPILSKACDRCKILKDAWDNAQVISKQHIMNAQTCIDKRKAVAEAVMPNIEDCAQEITQLTYRIIRLAANMDICVYKWVWVKYGIRLKVSQVLAISALSIQTLSLQTAWNQYQQ